MNYNDWVRLIERKVDSLLEEVRKDKGTLRPPIDLDGMREKFGVIAVEERLMIPEAAIETTQGGFKVYLQSNFVDQLGSGRRRFTLAHELCHTFFYDPAKNPPNPIHRAPAASKRESLCHKGAGLLLVPTNLLRGEIKSLGGKLTAEVAAELATTFGVSVEVILRRLQDMSDPPAVDHATILVGPTQASSELQILAAYYGPWLLSHFARPRYGVPFREWLGSEQDASGVLLGRGFHKRLSTGRLVGSSPVYTSQKKFLLDINLQLLDDDPVSRAQLPIGSAPDDAFGR